MAKRARNLTIDMNLLGISSLQSIQGALDNELEHCTEKTNKLMLLFLSTTVKCYINERMINKSEPSERYIKECEGRR